VGSDMCIRDMMIGERAIDGLLLVGTEDPVVLKELDRHVPEIVLVDHRDEDGKYEAILSDGFGGAYAATKSLLDRGHHRIGFFGNEPGVSSFQDRLRGYWCAHMEAGIQPDPYLTIGARNKSENEKALKAYLASDLHPTAVVTSNDWYALMVIRVCRELNIRIPDDLSLIGFDDVAFATQIDPPLSTVSVNKEEMGRIAVRRLYSKICVRSQNSEPQPPVLSILPVQLKLRHTCRSLI
jgi:DNA-binding LacI/PurR family transcriptional regulator